MGPEKVRESSEGHRDRKDITINAEECEVRCSLTPDIRYYGGAEGL